MTDYKLASRRNFDRQAAQYDTASFGRHARALYPVLLAQLAQIPHRSVLDVGCGTGALLRQIKDRWPEIQCAGVDLSPGMVESARSKLAPHTPIVLGDAERLPFPGDAFEAVVCCDSFHHYPDPRAALAEIRRVLQPGGVLLLGDTTAPAGLRRAINLLLPLSRGGDVRLYGPSELTALLEEFFHGAVCRRIHSTSLLAWGIK